jgi:hypothetical protein
VRGGRRWKLGKSRHDERIHLGLATIKQTRMLASSRLQGRRGVDKRGSSLPGLCRLQIWNSLAGVKEPMAEFHGTALRGGPITQPFLDECIGQQPMSAPEFLGLESRLGVF